MAEDDIRLSANEYPGTLMEEGSPGRQKQRGYHSAAKVH